MSLWEWQEVQELLYEETRVLKKVTAMSKNKKKRTVKRTGRMRWSFDPNIPTHDFFEGLPLTDLGNLNNTVDEFVYWLEGDRFLAWEAVVCEEQGLPLSPQQEKALGSLFSFNDEAGNQILYINEIPRPTEPWYAILDKIVPHLLIEPFRTFEGYDDVLCDGWHRIMTALQEHGQGLSLPTGVPSCMEVVPADLRHKLWLQYCIEILNGLGQADELNLKEQTWRVDTFITRLRKCKESVAHLNLTIESLLNRVIFPDPDRPIFIKLMQEKLALGSPQEPIADRL
jgi:hypothetical protein